MPAANMARSFAARPRPPHWELKGCARAVTEVLAEQYTARRRAAVTEWRLVYSGLSAGGGSVKGGVLGDALGVDPLAQRQRGHELGPLLHVAVEHDAGVGGREQPRLGLDLALKLPGGPAGVADEEL